MTAARALSILAVALASCAPGVASDGTLGEERQAIVGGVPSDASDDATVMLVHLDASSPPHAEVCTATLVAPRLVLTARHCVAAADEQIGCDADGTPLVGAHVSSNFDPADLYVFTGKDRPAFTSATAPALDPTKWQPAGRGAEIVDDHSGTLCDHDLALLLLAAPIPNVPTAPLRLDGDVAPGEQLVTVGWGVTSTEDEPKQRQRRSGVTVKRVGPSSQPPYLTKSEILFDESICLGDSGGPVFSAKTGAVVAVVSRGGNGGDPGSGNAAATCIGAQNLATRVAPFKEIVTDAFQRAGAEPLLEAQPADDGCAMGRRASGSCGWLLAALGGLLLVRRRET